MSIKEMVIKMSKHIDSKVKENMATEQQRKQI